MKKFLSLVMALAMTLTLVTVGASATSFTDDSTITYGEAVSVINKIGVVDGYTDGSFNPTATLTRGAAAKIICNMILGPSTASALGATSAPFSDVPVSNVFSGYITYCAQAGIINGYADGTFKPAATVTGYQFMKMLLGALGYDGSIEGFTGSNWSVAVAKLAVSIGLDDGNDSFVGSKAMTREEACLYAFNTLLADEVEYKTAGTTIITTDGTKIVTGGSTASVKTDASSNTIYNEIADNGALVDTVQFAEEHFSKLALNSDFQNGHDGRTFSYKGTEFTSFVSTDTVLATSTNGTSATKLLTKGETGYAGYKMDGTVMVYKNGAYVSAGGQTTLSGVISECGTLNVGDVVQLIDSDSDSLYDTIAITTYTFSKITATTAETASGADATVTITGVGKLTESEVTTADFSALAKSDYVMYATIKTPSAASTDTVLVYEPTSMTGTMSSYTTSSGKVSMVIDGTTYKASAAVNKISDLTAATAYSNTDDSATFYVDANGYVVAVDGTSTTNYVIVDAIAYVTGSGTEDSDYIQARLLLSDGTTKVVKVASINTTTSFTENDTTPAFPGTLSSTASVNEATFQGIYSYTTNSKGEYKLTSKSIVGAADVTKGSAAVNSMVANSSTIYVYKTLDSDSNAVYKVYTGYAYAPTTSSAEIASVKEDGYATLVFVDATAGTVGDSTTDTVVFLSTDLTTTKDGSTTLYGYKAVVNGVEDTYYSTGTLAVGSTYALNTVYVVNVDDDGYISIPASNYTGVSYTKYATAVVSAAPSNGVLQVYNAGVDGPYTFDGTENVYVISDNEMTVGSIDDIQKGCAVAVKVTDLSSGTLSKRVAIDSIYVFALDGTSTAVAGTAAITGTGTISASGALNADGTTSAAISSAVVGDTVAVSAIATATKSVTITISGMGTSVTNTTTRTAGTVTTPNYALVAGDLGGNLTITVTTQEDGKDAVINVYTVSVN